MRAFFHSLPILGLALVACQQSVTPTPLRSLAGSRRVSLVCRDFLSGEGRDLRACPDFDEAPSDTEDRRTLALVTQTIRGEVAVIDLHEEVVLDADPWRPGKEFLTVGADPKSIVSTPGGVASFVAVGEPGLEAIYALPTSCVAAPKERERTRDVLLWSACRLPGRPGEMAILTDAQVAAGGGYRKSCFATEPADEGDAKNWYRASIASNPTVSEHNPCPADLSVEEDMVPAGRRKLLVTLPDLGKVAVFDAQALLNLGPGTFQDCIPDAVIELSNRVPALAVVQPLPPDLHSVNDAGQSITARTYTPDQIPSSAYGTPQPAGIAVSEGSLYVADLNVPLIHSVDVADVCTAHEVPDKALRPLSLDYPNDPVYTRELSVSGRTLVGTAAKQRFLYAVEAGRYELENEQNDALGSVMIFDLSDGASPTPVVRPRSHEITVEPADRIRFDAPVRKLQLITRDAPVPEDSTETAQVGVLCDPYPSSQTAGALYRTNTDYDKGASPHKLRGVFGVLALGNGILSAIDIEDWDAPCRRPVEDNPLAAGTDWRGCAHDPVLGGTRFATSDRAEDRTVTDEVSCNVIEPHRRRSAYYFATNSTVGTHSPSLAAFPRLSSKESGDLPTGRGDTEHKHPQMLAVAFPDERGGDSAFVYVGSTQYSMKDDARYRIERDPGAADNNSLLLPLEEPRIYSSQEEFSATFEGVILDRNSGLLQRYPNNDPGPGFAGPIQANQFLLRDPDAHFCGSGVEDHRIALETAQRMGLPAGSKEGLDFAEQHADFVVLTSDFNESEPYYTSEGVSECEVFGQRKEKPLHELCTSLFGTKDEPRGKYREFMIETAQDDDLLLTPRETGDAETLVRQARCCFLNVASYQVRAANQWLVRGNTLYHRMTGSADSACRVQTDAWRDRFRDRALEIASSACTTDSSNVVDQNCQIGPSVASDVCVVAQNTGAIPTSAFGTVLPKECVFESLKGRFAIYRGREPSRRDMAFKWKVTGGFGIMASQISTSAYQQNVVPTDMVYSEALDAFVVIDGESGGVNLVGMTNFAPLGQPYL